MSDEDTNIEITRPYPLDAKAKRQVTEHFIHRYQEAVKQREQSPWDELIQTGVAAVWEVIGEEVEQSRAVEKAQQLADQVAELDTEIERLGRALQYLKVDLQAL